MTQASWKRIAALGVLAATAATVAAATAKARAGRQPAQEDQVVFALSAKPPKGAIVLYGGKQADIQANWYKRYSTQPADWTVDEHGVATPKRDDISSKQEFGDCCAHAEWREPVDATGKTIGEGNSGVCFEGRYEVQILDSYGKPNNPEACGAFYSEIPARVLASRKPTEWQSYDIIFRAPRFDANGAITERPRATVFQNGILIHDNEEFPRMTGIQYDQYHDEAPTGPLILQGDHDPVQFRNVWIVKY